MRALAAKQVWHGVWDPESKGRRALLCPLLDGEMYDELERRRSPDARPNSRSADNLRVHSTEAAPLCFMMGMLCARAAPRRASRACGRLRKVGGREAAN